MVNESRTAQAFVGRDRRRASDTGTLGRVFAVGATAVLAVAVSLSAVAVSGASAPARVRDLGLVLDTASTLVALAVFAFCVARWRLVGESAPLWVGTGALVLAVAVVGVPNVVLPLLGQGRGGATAPVQAGLTVTLTLLVMGVVAHEVDTRLRLGPLVAGVAALVAALIALFAAWPALGRLVTVPATTGETLAGIAGATLVAGMWLAVATAYAVRGVRRRWLHGWCGVLAFALLLSQLADVAVGSEPDLWALTAGAVRATGLLVAAFGCALELGRAYLDQRSRLFDSELTLEAAAVQERLQAASRRTQRHAVRNAVVAIEGAAVTLERHLDRLSEGDRASLTHVLSSGVERLQRLMEDGRGPETVDLGDLAAAVVGDLGWEERARLDVPAGLLGVGTASQTAEVMRLLLDNADQRAPGEVVTVSGGRDGSWVVLRILDRGPGVSRQRRRQLQDRADGPPRVGGEISLLVAGRLMQDQGGDLWVEALGDGEAAFALCLRAADSGETGQEASAVAT